MMLLMWFPTFETRAMHIRWSDHISGIRVKCLMFYVTKIKSMADL